MVIYMMNAFNNPSLPSNAGDCMPCASSQVAGAWAQKYIDAGWRDVYVSKEVVVNDLPTNQGA